MVQGKVCPQEHHKSIEMHCAMKAFLQYITEYWPFIDVYFKPKQFDMTGVSV